MMNLIEQLKKHEGFEPDYYQCTADKKTIGYGRNVDNNPFTDEELIMLGRDNFDVTPMTEDEAEVLLVNDVKKVEASIKQLLPWHKLNSARQAVCTNMAFNLGTGGFSRFKRMVAAINDFYFEKAANEMLDSRWAKQVHGRAIELAEQMKTGHWQ